jgi:hypothetical protein
MRIEYSQFDSLLFWASVWNPLKPKKKTKKQFWNKNKFMFRVPQGPIKSYDW